MLLAFLDYHRDTLRLKTEGLTSEQLDAPLPPCTLTLGGMLKHLALRGGLLVRVRPPRQDRAEPWASVDWDADPDWDCHTAADDTPEQLRALLDDAVAASDAALRAALAEGGLDGSRRAGAAHGRRRSACAGSWST